MRKLSCVALLVLGWLANKSCGQDASAPLPTIRQFWLDTSELPAHLGGESWSMIPRVTFEQAYQKALRIQQALRRPPWATRAVHRASLKGQQLDGESQLTLFNPHGARAVTRLSPWNLPLTGPVRSGTGESGQPASTAERSLELAVGSGSQQFVFPWALQGEQRRDGVWFALQLPGSSMTTLEVILPATQRLDCPGGRSLLTGPFAVPGTTEQRWVLQLGNAARHDVQLVARSPRSASTPAWTEARLDADFVLDQKACQARYELDVQRWQGRLTEVTLRMPDRFVPESLILRQGGQDIPLGWQQGGSPGTLQITLPETVEQRAHLVLAGPLEPEGSGQFIFDYPRPLAVHSLRPSLRLIAGALRPLVDWDWGDFGPVQAPELDRLSGQAAEGLQVALASLVDPLMARPPRARPRMDQDTAHSVMETWWHVSPQQSQLRARCTCKIQQNQVAFLNWLIPEGWSVRDVQGLSSTALRQWAWQPGMPLIVEAKTPWQQGQTVSLQISLAPRAPFQADQPARLAFPHVKPGFSGPLAATYALTLERQGRLVPANASITQAPGTEAIPTAEQAQLWSSVAAAADGFWNVPPGGSGGELVVRSWPNAGEMQVDTLVLQEPDGWKIRYRLSVQPITHPIRELSLTFSRPVPELRWRHGAGTPIFFSAASDRSGKLQFSEPITRGVQVQAELPWNPEEPVPLLEVELARQMSLQLPAHVRITPSEQWEGPFQQVSTDVAASTSRIYRYSAGAPSPRIESLVPSALTLLAPRVHTRFNGSVAEHEYTAQIPPHPNPLTITLPPEAQLLQAIANAHALPVSSSLLLPGSKENTQFVMKYRSPVHGLAGIYRLILPLPQWEAAVQAASPLASWSTTGSWFSSAPRLVCPFRLLWDRGQESAMPREYGWIDSGWGHLLGMGSVLLFILFKPLARGWQVALLVNVAVAAYFLPREWLMLPVWVSLAVCLNGASWVQRRTAKQFFSSLKIRVLLAVALASSASWLAAAPPEDKPLAVYILPGATRDKAQDRIIAPATFWTRVQALALQDDASPSRHFWVESATVQVFLEEERVRVQSRWTCHLRDEFLELPWSIPHAPQSILQDGLAVQPHVASGPFGLRTVLLPLRGAGKHDLQISWEFRRQRTGLWNTALVHLPGAPRQEITIHGPAHMSELYLGGLNGPRSKVAAEGGTAWQAQAGLSRQINLTWAGESSGSPELRADLAVLWEHRLFQSVAHVLASYHVDQGSIQQVELELPLGLHVRQLDLNSELQADPLPQIKFWQVHQRDQRQLLTVYFQRPISGQFHLLLQLPWKSPNAAQRNRVPLFVPRLVGVQPRRGFVAYLLDGVKGKVEQVVEAPSPPLIDFARPWLPSVGSLPPDQILHLSPENRSPPVVKLSAGSDECQVRLSPSLKLNGREYTYFVKVQVESPRSPLSYLSAELPGSWSGTQVQGDSVARWNILPKTADRPARLEMWLKPPTKSTASTDFSLTLKQSMNWQPGKPVGIPVDLPRWNNSETRITPLIVGAEQSVQFQTISPTSLKSLMGPWQDPQALGVFQFPAPNSDSAITFAGAIPQQVPTARSTIVSTSWGPEWHLVLQAPPGSFLPPAMEFVNPQLSLFTFDADVSIAARPYSATDGSLRWRIQPDAAWKQLTIKKRLTVDQHGKAEIPKLQFPQFPQLQTEALLME